MNAGATPLSVTANALDHEGGPLTYIIPNTHSPPSWVVGGPSITLSPPGSQCSITNGIIYYAISDRVNDVTGLFFNFQIVNDPPQFT